jgi:hypothetical protein
MGIHDILFEVAESVVDAGPERHRIGVGETGALARYAREQIAREQLAPDDDELHERLASLFAQLMLIAMTAQHEVDVRRLEERRRPHPDLHCALKGGNT